MKILIADKSPRIRNLIMEILGSKGNEYAECCDESQLKRIHSSFKPNTVIVDIELTGVNCSFLKDKFPCSKIIVTSRYSENDLLNKKYRNGIDGFVMKENLMILKDLVNISKSKT